MLWPGAKLVSCCLGSEPVSAAADIWVRGNRVSGPPGVWVSECQCMKPENAGLVHDILLLWLEYLADGELHYSPLKWLFSETSVTFI